MSTPLNKVSYHFPGQAELDGVWDVIVVGGGMVGAALALGLGLRGFSVLLMEREAVQTDWQPDRAYEPRVSALTRASENILKNLGVWPGIEQRRCHAFTAMHIWDEATPTEIHFSAEEVGEPNLGYTVENRIIQEAIWEQIAQCDAIKVMLAAQIERVELQHEQACLVLDDGQQLKTQLLVGADGARSQIRQKAFIGLDTHDYEQCAVVGCVKTELSHQDTCWQRYRQDGPFAFLAMGENISSIAWYLPSEKREWALSLSDAEFAREITHASEARLGQVIEVAQRVAFPLVRQHAEHYVKPNLALVGDAAHTIHPQAGQGVNLGLLDIAALIDVLTEAQAHSRPIGQWSVLRRYERWRRGDNAIVQRSMEGFDWLFKQDNALKTRLRSHLLPLANRLEPVKRWLIEQALRGREPLPELAREVCRKGL
ncbi:UbiH/UbiF/VisC/COQ6 family ubiquinone biosynthesis hydroxylase [Thiomicrorhabdus sp. zzn3]|uniref:UbiH/UbiF/VisC/COQ6 family ubiquinone biosynthesis hydroxylase n=1 Tax=Thiomicrorhabdus sp. zzn3 TaxID=3039775 RepID=UPI00243667E2|nr:UbiH/UbiF/VisC/COQ6 family ubiquinone biosynthesis hydroxylase [Thiomicrorhabdus sp. zzn3]MDG6777756.1 UbiH/UbiF/VisC/COQ6 family ubiquinone biosynthesis hydroxylase [Thiomicrorhabdus sp. zzn3]